jgi:hypothetical protein
LKSLFLRLLSLKCFQHPIINQHILGGLSLTSSLLCRLKGDFSGILTGKEPQSRNDHKGDIQLDALGMSLAENNP